ncbi:hypothetical protein EXIGLDRAFT_39787 [Exidia glandulosa HHB12029]|uniref:Uncharacterized protein n=1 Tax=Exidia glandulosa HHB12029 TaxID=1314781 RepID=A0A165INQ7_EXIGL|nr:hypothetical protein EXIGLDRAFT_39787 [Exidia glandulosa HHB12029]
MRQEPAAGLWFSVIARSARCKADARTSDIHSPVPSFSAALLELGEIFDFSFHRLPNRVLSSNRVARTKSNFTIRFSDVESPRNRSNRCPISRASSWRGAFFAHQTRTSQQTHTYHPHRSPRLRGADSGVCLWSPSFVAFKRRRLGQVRNPYLQCSPSQTGASPRIRNRLPCTQVSCHAVLGVRLARPRTVPASDVASMRQYKHPPFRVRPARRRTVPPSM